MRRKWKGYFTVEASLIMPIVLFLYLLIILASLFLYCRCAISQDNFLLGMRAGTFTWGGGEDHYGEVIYGETEKGGWEAEAYVLDRLYYKRRFYPFFPSKEGECRISGETVVVQTRQKALNGNITKNIQRLNPVEIMRRGRREQNA